MPSIECTLGRHACGCTTPGDVGIELSAAPASRAAHCLCGLTATHPSSSHLAPASPSASQAVWVQAQRAGNVPNDSQALFPNIWKWKKPGYQNVCSDFVATLPPEDRAGVDFPNKAGYYEAGSAPPATPLPLHALVSGPWYIITTKLPSRWLSAFEIVHSIVPSATR